MLRIKGRHQAKSYRQNICSFVIGIFTQPTVTAKFVSSGIRSAITTTSNFLLGDLPEIIKTKGDIVGIAQRRAEKSHDIKAIVRIGPKFYPYNIVVFSPYLDSKCHKQLVKKIMDIDTKHARSPYGLFQTLTADSNFFLAMEGEQGMAVRKSILPLAPRNFYKTSISLVQEFINNELKKPVEDTIFYNKITNLIQRIVAMEMLGDAEVPDSIIKVIDDIEKHIRNRGHLPSLFVKALPTTRQLINQFKKSVQEYLAAIKNKNPSPLLRSILEKKNNEKDLYLMFSFMLATTNLSEVVIKALLEINAHLIFDHKVPPGQPETMNDFRIKLHQELAESDITFDQLMDKKSTPYLHALYEESLQSSREAMPNILRYSKNGVPELSIPKNSSIIFYMRNRTLSLREQTHAIDFDANRMLDSKEGIASYYGSGVRFGLGKRPCPAKAISETIFKAVVALVLKNSTVKTIEYLPHFCRVVSTDSQPSVLPKLAC